jgi:hypothetical protein
MAGFLFLGVKIWFVWEHFSKKMSNLSQFTVLIVHLVKKCYFLTLSRVGSVDLPEAGGG